jgi:hypothetical protein
MSYRRSILPALPDIEEIILNLDQPEQNCNGMLVLKTVDIMVGDTEQIDVITIFKPLYDPRDIKNIKAVLDADGGAITLTEPVVPCYFLKEVKEMHTLEDALAGGTKGCILTKRSHMLAATNVQAKDLRAQKKTILRFPEGIICKHDGKGKLKNNFRMLKAKMSAGEPHPVQWVFWKLIIDSERRHLERQASEDSDDGFAEAQKRMSAMNVG